MWQLGNPVLDRILASAEAEAGTHYSRDLHTFTGDTAELETCLLLYGLIRRTLPKSVIQVGTCKGFSAAIMAQALEDNGAGHLYTIDINPAPEAEALAAEAGLASRITFLLGHSQDDDLKGLPDECDFAFVDGDHGFKAALADLERFGAMMSDGGFLVHHDTGLDPDNGQRASRKFARHGWVSRLHIPAAVGVSVGVDIFQVQRKGFLGRSDTPDTWQEYRALHG